MKLKTLHLPSRFAAVLLVAVAALAAAPWAGAISVKNAPTKLKTVTVFSNVPEKKNTVVQPLASVKPNKVEQKTDVAVTNDPRRVTQVISEAPEGMVKRYNRSGMEYHSYYSNGKKNIEQDEQEGLLSIVYADNNEVYLLNPVSKYLPGSYVKGTINGNTITVPLPQTIYPTNDGYNLELAWVNIVECSTSDKADRETTTATYTIDGNTISLNGSSASHVLGVVYDDDNTWCGVGDWNSVYTETELDEIVPPTGVTSMPYYYSGTMKASSEQHAFSSTVNLAKDGNDIYFQGLAAGDTYLEILPEAWARGTLDGDKVTIPMGQYLGFYDGFPIYLVGNVNQDAGDISFTYDADANTYTLNNNMYINGKTDAIYYYSYTLAGAVLYPSFTPLPRGDVDGDGVVDIGDLSCIVNLLLGYIDRASYDERDDLNDDGTLDVRDINELIKILLDQ